MNDPRAIYEDFVEGISDSTGDYCRSTCPCPKKSKRSFHFHKDTGYYGCWSCGDHGSLYKFLVEHGLETGRARQVVQEVRDAAPTPEVDLRKRQLRKQTTLGTLPDYILAAYHNCPVALTDAGFDEGLLERYDVGFDTQRNRITFAIRDHEGNLAGVSGRTVIAGVQPKYLVYDARAPDPQKRKPAGPFYEIEPRYIANNRAHVYGLHTFWGTRAHKDPTGREPIILTEGYKSTLWLRQLGFDFATGLMGSEMTAEQQRLLGQTRGPFVVLLDHEPGKQIPDPQQVAKRLLFLRAKNPGRADKIRTCSAVDIALRLRQFGQALIGVYPPDKKEGTAPDDLSKAEIEYAIENAITPTVALVRAMKSPT